MFRFRPVLNLGIRFSQIEENTSTKTKRFRLVLNLKNNSANREKYAYGICTMPMLCFLSLEQDAVERSELTWQEKILYCCRHLSVSRRLEWSACRRTTLKHWYAVGLCIFRIAVCVLVRRQSTISQLDDLDDHCYKQLLSVLFIGSLILSSNRNSGSRASGDKRSVAGTDWSDIGNCAERVSPVSLLHTVK